MTGESSQGGETPRSWSEFTVEEDQLTVLAGGEVDLYAMPEIKARVLAEMEAQEIRTLKFDLSEADYIDSIFMGVLVGFYRRMKNNGGQVGLIGVNKSIMRKQLEIEGITRVIPIFDEIDDQAEPSLPSET